MNLPRPLADLLGEHGVPRVTGLLRGRGLLVGNAAATMWKRLVAVADDESAFEFPGSGREDWRRSPFSSLGPRRRCLGPTVRPPLADPSSFFDCVPRLASRRSARAGDPRPRFRALNEGRRGGRSRLRPAVHPGDGPVSSDPRQRARRRDVGPPSGRLDEAGRRGRRSSRAASRHRRHRQPPALCSTPWIPTEVDPEGGNADPAAIRQKVDALDWAGFGLRPSNVHQEIRRPAR